MLCPKCGRVYTEGIDRCAVCGIVLVNTPVPRNNQPGYGTNAYPQVLQRCMSCGAMIPFNPQVNQVYCPTCGKPMSGADKRWSTGRIIALACLLLTIAASFLPFFTYSILGSSVSINLWSENFILLAIIGMIIVAYGLYEVAKDSPKLSKDIRIIGILILVDIIIQFFYNKNRLQSVDTGFGQLDLSNLLNPGVGFYLIVISCIGMIVSGYMIKAEKK